MEFGNLRNWLGSDPRSREQRENRELWEAVEGLWQRSPAAEGLADIAMRLYPQVQRLHRPEPALPILHGLAWATYNLLEVEDIQAIEADWPAVDGDLSLAISFRAMLARRRQWAVDFGRRFGVFSKHLLIAYREFLDQLPDACFRDWSEEEGVGLEVPLVELLDDPASVIEAFGGIPYDPECRQLELFNSLRELLQRNYLVASGYPPDFDTDRVKKLVYPSDQRGVGASDLADIYLAGTPFRALLDTAVPFEVPEEARFEHCHIVGGTGHGKTQLMQRMILADLVAAQTDLRSVVVIDSQGDLINKLMRLALFDPEAPDSLADRLVIIDPADIEFPAALNLFDAHLDRLAAYRPIDRERTLNGVVELYETFFGDMLGAELTQKQGVIFRYLARLMVTIPGATIHTLMELMGDGRPFKPHMDRLDGSARYFFETEFFHPSFAATKKQILRRLWGVLSTPAFERMFAQKANKLDLFAAMNEGKIILVSTAKDLLKEDGSALFGRFFIAMLKQAALERSVLPAGERTPTFVYVDEAQEYFDDSVETILNQARKFRVGLTMAHQTLDQLSPRLRATLHSNTSLKCVGGVSARDARGIAEELHTTADFIESMRRRGDRSEFAVWLKQTTPKAIRLSVPLGFLERQPLLSEEAFEQVLEANRARYCGTEADIVGFAMTVPADPEPPPARSAPAERAVVPLEPDTPVPVQEELSPPPSRERPVREPPVRSQELGKGGSQHRYVQQLIKGLAEERGFRAVIEEPVADGQVDVGLHREGLAIACEISVTSTASYEAKNLAKCLQSGFARVFAVAADAKRLRAIEALARERLSDEEMERIDFLTPNLLAAALDSLAAPPDETTLVRGYRVKVSRTVVGAAEALDRRAAIARVVAKSMRDFPKV